MTAAIWRLSPTRNWYGLRYCTAVILLEGQGARTKYTAIVKHGDEASSKKHEGMGFHEGWGAALDQLVALAKTWQAA